MRGGARRSSTLLVCLGAVYFLWGSSFLFTKIAVSTLPAAMFSGLRFIAAGILLTSIAHLYGRDRLPTRQIEWRHVIIAGFFMVFVSNGLNTWAIQYIPSNQSALLNATSAFWIAGLGVFGPNGHPLTRRSITGLSIGFLGATLMLVPEGHLSTASMLAQLGVLAACLGWALGTLYYRSIETSLSPLLFMGLQMFMGGSMLLCLGFAHGDIARWSPNASSIVAMSYLTLCSSCLAYTAYGWLTLNCTPSVIGTYSYVNPAIAAFLGWRFLHEHLSSTQLIGMVIIIIGVCTLTLGSVVGRTAAMVPPAKRSA